ncbi:MAG: HEAT repeat domain-containing protein, partial [Verrucomicrobiota bacterium]
MNNLAADPAQAGRLQTMRLALRSWQLEIHDTALVPEFERKHRAEQNTTTIYEMTRNPELYDLPAYLDAADLATAGMPEHLPQLLELMEAEDSALRYWSAIGLLMLPEDARSGAVPALVEALEDESHEVRAYAAWALVKQE